MKRRLLKQGRSFVQQIVIDTNILVNALKSKNDDAKSVLLLEDVFKGKYEIGLSTEIVREYIDR